MEFIKLTWQQKKALDWYLEGSFKTAIESGETRRENGEQFKRELSATFLKKPNIADLLEDITKAHKKAAIEWYLEGAFKAAIESGETSHDKEIQFKKKLSDDIFGGDANKILKKIDDIIDMFSKGNKSFASRTKNAIGTNFGRGAGCE